MIGKGQIAQKRPYWNENGLMSKHYEVNISISKLKYQVVF